MTVCQHFSAPAQFFGCAQRFYCRENQKGYRDGQPQGSDPYVTGNGRPSGKLHP